MLAWAARPSDETYAYQLRIRTPAVVASAVVGLVATVTLLPFPATVVVPAASYVLIRSLLYWHRRGDGTLTRRGLQFAARGGEMLTLLAAAFMTC